MSEIYDLWKRSQGPPAVGVPSAGEPRPEDGPVSPTPTLAPPPETRQEAPTGVYEAWKDADLAKRRATTADFAQEAALLGYVTANQKRLAPQQAEEVANYAAATGIEPDVVERNLDKVRALAQTGQIDFEKAIKDHPTIAKWLRDPRRSGFVLANQLALERLDAAVQGRTEIYPAEKIPLEEQVQALEQGVYEGVTRPRVPHRYAEAITRAFTQDVPLWYELGKNALGIGNVKYESVPGHGMVAREMSPDEARERQARINKLKAGATSEFDFVGDQGPGAVNTSRRWLYDAMMFPFKNAPMLLGSVALPAAGGAMAGAVGAEAALTGFNFGYFMPGMVDKLKEMKGPNGEALSEGQALAFGSVAALAGGWALAKGMGPTFSKYLDAQIKGVAEGGSAALSEYTISKMLAEQALTYGKHVAQGTTGMVVQAGIDAATEQTVGAFALGRPLEPKVVAEAMLYATKQALYDMSALALWGSGRKFLEDAGRIRRATNAYQRNEVMRRGFEAEGLSPERQAEFVQQSQTTPGTAKHLFLDRDMLEKHAAANKLDLAEVLKEVGVDYAKVLESGAEDVAVPVESAGKLFKNKIWADFTSAEGRYHPDDPSYGRVIRELREFNDRTDTDMSRPIEQWEPDHQTIYQVMHDRALEALKKLYETGKKLTPGDSATPEFEADAYARMVLRSVRYMENRAGGTAKAWFDQMYAEGKIEFKPEGWEIRPGEYAGASYLHSEKQIALYPQYMSAFYLPHEWMHQFVNVLSDAGRKDPAAKKLYDQWSEAMGYKGGEYKWSEEFRKSQAEYIKKAEEWLEKYEGFSPEGKAKFAEGVERSKAGIEEAKRHVEERLSAGDVRDRGRISRNEERVAYQFMSWLAEGASPSVEMADVFQRFRALAYEWEVGTGKPGANYAWAHINYWEKAYPTEEAPNTGVKVATEPPKGWGEAGPAPAENVSLIEPKLRDAYEALFRSVTEVDRAQQEAKLTQRIDAVYERLDPAQREVYATMVAKGTMTAQEILAKWIVENGRAKNKAFFKQERERFAQQTVEELKGDLTYRLLHFFRTGEMWENPHTPAEQRTAEAETLRDIFTRPDGKPYKILESSIYEFFGKDKAGAAEFVRSLNETLQKQVVVKDPRGNEEPKGIPLQAIVELLGDRGYQSVNHMVAELKMALPEQEKIARQVEMKMQQKYGDALIRNPEQLVEEALWAAHNPTIAAKIIMELRALQRDLDPARALRASSISEDRMIELARDILDRAEIRNISPTKFVNAERHAWEKVTEYLEKGNVGKAYDYMEKRLLNFYLFREARERKSKLDQEFQRLAEKAADEKWIAKLGKEDKAYRDLHTEILKSIGIMGRVEGEQANLKALDDFLARAAERDQPTAQFNVEVLRALIGGDKGWGDLLPGEAHAVFGAITSIRHLAEELNESRMGESRRRVADLHDAAAKHLAIFEDSHKPHADKSQEPWAKKLMDSLRAQMANLTDPHGILKMLGPEVFDHVWRGYKDAAYRKLDLQREVLDYVTKAWTEYQGKEGRYTIIPELEQMFPDEKFQGPRTKSWLMTAFFWLGGETSRKKLLAAHPTWQIDNFFKMAEKYLSHDDLKWIDSMHKLAENKLWKHESDLYFRRTGLDLKKEKALGYVINGVKYDGGYFPVRYDKDVSKQAAAGRAESVEKERAYRRAPETGRTYTHERSESYVDIPDLRWENYPSHIAEVINDVAMGEFVHEAGKVLLDYNGNMYGLMSRKLGPEVAQQIQPWLEVLARDSQASVPKHLKAIAESQGYGRSALMYGVLGWNVSIVAADILHPIAANLMVEGSWYTVTRAVPALLDTTQSAMRRAVGATDQVREFALANSRELPAREQHVQAKLQEMLAEFGVRGAEAAPFKARRAIQKTAFVLMEEIDKLTSTAIWTAKYRQMIGEGVEHPLAIRAADEAVNASMPTHLLGEMPSLLRDKRGLGSMLVFYGYYSKLYNMMQQQGHQMVVRPFAEAKDTGEYGKALGSAAIWAGRAMAMMLVTNVWGDYLMGHGKQKDESWGEWYARKSLAAPFGVLPYATSFVTPMADYAVTGKWRPANILRAPGYAIAYRGMDMLGKLASSKREQDKKVFDALEFMLFAAALPALQPRRTAEAAYQMISGKRKPTNVAQGFSDLTYGPPGKQNAQANPLSSIAGGR